MFRKGKKNSSKKKNLRAGARVKKTSIKTVLNPNLISTFF
jgi:hypothetical protein